MIQSLYALIRERCWESLTPSVLLIRSRPSRLPRRSFKHNLFGLAGLRVQGFMTAGFRAGVWEFGVWGAVGFRGRRV